jgi:hypothetical protein
MVIVRDLHECASEDFGKTIEKKKKELLGAPSS